MRKNPEKPPKEKKKTLNEQDFRLWHAFTRDIEPLSDLSRADLDELLAQMDGAPIGGQAGSAPVTPRKAKVSVPSAVRPALVSQQPPQLDARTEARLRRGKMPVEATIDLHGYNQEQAHLHLNRFVLDSYRRGRRCLLVITGKGSRSAGDAPAGVIKQKLPLWLSMSPLREITLKVFPAVQKDGGTGASYIYLRREREPRP